MRVGPRGAGGMPGGRLPAPAAAAVVPTTREAEVLGLYLSGLAAKQVAHRLGLKESTVKEYLRRVRARYAAAGRPASTRMELYFRAVEDGLLPRAEPQA